MDNAPCQSNVCSICKDRPKTWLGRDCACERERVCADGLCLSMCGGCGGFGQMGCAKKGPGTPSSSLGYEVYERGMRNRE